MYPVLIMKMNLLLIFIFKNLNVFSKEEKLSYLVFL